MSVWLTVKFHQNRKQHMQLEEKGQSGPSVSPKTQPRVIVVGNLTIDDVVLPDGTTQMSSVGGNSLYTSLGARLWQPRVGLVTRRGEDFQRVLISMLRCLGVATEGIGVITCATVRHCVIYENIG